jgi:DNA primase
VQLSSLELGTLWAHTATKAQSPSAARHSDWQPDDVDEHSPTSNWNRSGDGDSPDNWKGKRKWEGRGKWESKRVFRPPLRGPLATRADHAVRILLGHSELWETLSNEDHALLCELPAPHGPLIAWLEGQLHEHGPLVWSALREELQELEAQELAVRLMADPTLSDGAASDASADSGVELRDLLNRMLVERIKEQETQAIADSTNDPAALVRYRELHARRQQLELAIRPAA